jgi:O-antigen/teichoic acid export membrane protein
MTDIPDLSPQDKKDIFDNVKGISVYKISLAVVKSIDNIVITLFIGLTAVGLLSNYTMIIANVGLIFVSMKPSIGSLNATDNNT